MKKILLFLVLATLLFVPSVFADRNTATTTAYSSTQLIRRGDAKIYSVSFVPTSNGGNFILLDAVSNTTFFAGGATDVKAEGSEATSLNSQFQDFSNKPLEFGTGIYLIVTNGYVILRYE